MAKLPKGFKEIEGTELRKYQKIAVAFGINKDSTGQLHDMGLGKTIIATTIARYRLQNNKSKRVLVVCPASLPENWKKKIQEWSEHKAVILPSNRQKRLHTALTNKAKYHIINYESLHPLLRDSGIDLKETVKAGEVIRGEAVYGDAVKMSSALLNRYDEIILDESGKYLKHITSNISKSCMLLSEYVKYKMILTGTLIGKHPLNLWVQFYCLDGGKTFGDNFYWFRNKFFYRVSMGAFQKWVLKKQYIKVFNRVINEICIRFTWEDVEEELPSMIEDSIEITFNSALRDAYDKLKKGIITDIEIEKGKKQLNTTNILTRLIRLQQFTSGFVSSGRGKESKLKYTPKLDALVEKVETIMEYGESVVIWCRFTPSIDMIAEQLKKYEVLVLDGRVTNKKKKYSIWREFQTSTTKNILIAQCDSGGFGIELFKENLEAKYENAIIYENTWGSDTRLQVKKRIHRSGLRNKYKLTDLTVKDTIDERILSVLKEEREIADEIEKLGVKKFLK